MKTLATIHAVPDGDPCSLALIQRHQFIYFEGHVWFPSFPWVVLVRITDNHTLDVSDLWEAGHLFQPVRLEQTGAQDNG